MRDYYGEARAAGRRREREARRLGYVTQEVEAAYWHKREALRDARDAYAHRAFREKT